jgi:hypothetical protein
MLNLDILATLDWKPMYPEKVLKQVQSAAELLHALRQYPNDWEPEVVGVQSVQFIQSKRITPDTKTFPRLVIQRTSNGNFRLTYAQYEVTGERDPDLGRLTERVSERLLMETPDWDVLMRFMWDVAMPIEE